MWQPEAGHRYHTYRRRIARMLCSRSVREPAEIGGLWGARRARRAARGQQGTHVSSKRTTMVDVLPGAPGFLAARKTPTVTGTRKVGTVGNYQVGRGKFICAKSQHHQKHDATQESFLLSLRTPIHSRSCALRACANAAAPCIALALH